MNTQKTNQKQTFHLSDWLWDIWCIVSIIGIWPRFIEPKLLRTTKLSLKVPKLPDQLKNLKILQLSDLHFNSQQPNSYLNKIIDKSLKLKPDLIVFTGDFLCSSRLEDRDRLKKFLNSFHAPLGCYASLGNHDYEQCLDINDQGDYDLIHKNSSLITKGFKRLFSTIKLTGKVTKQASNIPTHHELIKLLSETPFELLNNKTKTIDCNGTSLNISGVGEHMFGQCLPEKAFENWTEDLPGIVLAHNPDCVPALRNFPGDIIFCGHTHGAQVNLPWMWKKFILIENLQFKRGLVKENNKWVYVNRGVGSIFPFRWFSTPELLLVTLE